MARMPLLASPLDERAPRRRRQARWCLAPVEEAGARPTGTLAGNAAATGARRFVILVVDDDPFMTDMFPRRLRKFLRPDVEIHVAHTPAEAKGMIVALSPDAIVSDYNLRQDETGLDVLALAQREAPQGARILFSGHRAVEIQGLETAPIHAYFEKPMKLDDLVGPILDAIEGATGQSVRGGDRAA